MMYDFYSKFHLRQIYLHSFKVTVFLVLKAEYMQKKKKKAQNKDKMLPRY